MVFTFLFTLKGCDKVLALVFVYRFNASLRCGVFPRCGKTELLCMFLNVARDAT